MTIEAAREWEAAKFGAAREKLERILNSQFAAVHASVPTRLTARFWGETLRDVVDETLSYLEYLLIRRLQLRAETIRKVPALASRDSIEALQAEIQPLVDDSLRRFEEFSKTNRRWIGDTNEGPARTALADINSRAQSLGNEAWFEAAALIGLPRLLENDEPAAPTTGHEAPVKTDEDQLPSAGAEPDRKGLVAAYIDEVFVATGVRITKSQIWRVAGYRDDTTFLRWCKPKSKLGHGTTADENFRRVLREKPHLDDPTLGRKKAKKPTQS